jgi:hypothetical protein
VWSLLAELLVVVLALFAIGRHRQSTASASVHPEPV